MTGILHFTIGLAITGLVTSGAFAAIPTFQELMDPGVFPEPQRGMRVESGTESDSGVSVMTTGALITIDGTRGEIAL